MRKILVLFLALSMMLTSISGVAEATPFTSSKDTLILSVNANTNGFDPISSGYSYGVMAVVRNIYECLVRRDGSGNLYPVLATEWAWDEDNMGITFTLRQDVSFTNGDAFNADDVVWTYKEYYLSSAFGASEDTFDFANIEKVDDYTVRIPLLKPAGDAIIRLCDQKYSIYSQQAVEQYGEFIASNPIGTGPYKFVSFVEGDEAVLEANEEYWGDVPSIKSIIMRIIPEPTQAMIELENGNIDMILDADYMDVARVLNGEVEGVSAYKYSSGIIQNLWFNYRKEWTQNKALRQAINYAINKADIVAASYEGFAIPSEQNVGSSYAGAYDETLNETPVYGYNPDKAKELLAGAGYQPGELTLDFLVDQDITVNTNAQLIKKNLEDIGINVVITSYDSMAWVGNVLEGQGDIHMNISSNGNGYPIKYLECSNPNRSPNWDDIGASGLWDEVFAKYDEASALSDRDQIYAAVREGVRIMIDEALCVPIVEPQSYVLHASNLRNFEFFGNDAFSFSGAYFD